MMDSRIKMGLRLKETFDAQCSEDQVRDMDDDPDREEKWARVADFAEGYQGDLNRDRLAGEVYEAFQVATKAMHSFDIRRGGTWDEWKAEQPTWAAYWLKVADAVLTRSYR